MAASKYVLVPDHGTQMAEKITKKDHTQDLMRNWICIKRDLPQGNRTLLSYCGTRRSQDIFDRPDERPDHGFTIGIIYECNKNILPMA
jgi:hypothetical protein